MKAGALMADKSSFSPHTVSAPGSRSALSR
jgi:hypothetical protein